MNAVPIFCGDVMSERVCIIVLCDLRIARCARGEEHQHRVVAARGIFRSFEFTAEQFIFGVEIVPAVAVAADKYLADKRRTVLLCRVYLRRDVAVRRADNGAYARRVESVIKVMLLQLTCCGNRNRTEFMKRDNGKPELVVTFENKHNAVALFYAERFEIVRRSCGLDFHLLEREVSFDLVFVKMYHRGLIGIFVCELVNHVKAEIELLRIFERDFLKTPVRIFLRFDEFMTDERFRRSCGSDGVADRRFGNVFAVEYNREEKTVFAVHRDHSVRSGGIIENAVSLFKNFRVVSYADFEFAAQHKVKFLPGVFCGMYRTVLKGFVVFVFYPIRFAEFVSEKRGKVLYLDAFLFCRFASLALSCNRVG